MSLKFSRLLLFEQKLGYVKKFRPVPIFRTGDSQENLIHIFDNNF